MDGLGGLAVGYTAYFTQAAQTAFAHAAFVAGGWQPFLGGILAKS